MNLDPAEIDDPDIDFDEDCPNCGGTGYSHHDCGEDTGAEGKGNRRWRRSEMPAKKPLLAFVRKSTANREDERIVSFQIPPEIPQAEVLRRGWAIDGNSAKKAARANGVHSLPDELRRLQIVVAEWIGQYGYAPEWK